MRIKLERSTAALAGGAALVLTGIGRRLARRPAADDLLPEPPPPVAPAVLPIPGAELTALDRMAAGPDVPRAVAEAYRETRRAFNTAREAPDDLAFERLRARVEELWACAILTEPSSPKEARRLAREARRLLRLLEERRAVLALARAAEQHPATSAELRAAHKHLRTRATAIERRVSGRGRDLFAAKPARIARRIAEDR